MVAKRRRRISWSDLPTEIIHEISKNLKNRDDLSCFRQICKKWRKSSVSFPQKILSPVLPIPIPSNSNNTLPFHHSTRPLILQVSSVYLIKPTRPEIENGGSMKKPWLVLAEESIPGKIQLRHCLTEKRVRNLPTGLDLTRFSVTEVARGYSFKFCNFLHKILICSASDEDDSCVEAIVLYYEGVLGKITLTPSGNNNNDSDNDKESKECCRWEMLKRSKSYNRFKYLDDVVMFKETYCALDRMGRVYVLGTEEMDVRGFLVTEPLYRRNDPGDRRKRLVVDIVSMELYLVERRNTKAKDGVQFKVFKFDEESKCWVVVDSFGDERVLFVGSGHCFFARFEDFPGCEGNCIVFASNCFTQYCGRDSPDESLFADEDVDVGVYQMGKSDNFRLLSSAYPVFAEAIWPPPPWFSTNKRQRKDDDEDTESGSSIQILSDKVSSDVICLSDDCEEDLLTENSGASIYGDWDEEEGEEMQAETSSSDEKASEPSYTSESSHSNGAELEKEEAETNSHSEQPHFEAIHSEETRPSALKPVVVVAGNNSDHPSATFAASLEVGFKEGNTKTGTSEGNYENHEKAISPLTSPEKKVTVLTDVKPTIITDVKPTMIIPSVPPGFEKLNKTVKFQGMDIRAELIPTLETILARHGDLIGEDTIRSKKILATTLEELAGLVNTLQKTTGRSLTASQADDLKSNLLDFQRQGLKVDWLVPIVDKAVALQKNQTLVESIMDLDKDIAEIEDKEKAFLAESAKKKQVLKESRAYLCSQIGLPETSDNDINLDSFLGKGLVID